ncbi:MAG TPA: hypothetical protein VGK47_01600 [Nitrososphaeraceae archaeon]
MAIYGGDVARLMLLYTTIKIGRNSKELVIFITLYLLRGAFVSLTRSATLKLTNTLAWDIEIIGYYIFSAAPIIKLTMIDKLRKVVRLGLDLTELNGLRFGIQSKIQGLAELVGISSLGVIMLLRRLLDSKDASSDSIYVRQRTPTPIEKKLYQEHASLQDSRMYNAQVSYQKTRNALVPRRLIVVLKPKNTKRIEFAEVLGEGEGNEDDTLIST